MTASLPESLRLDLLLPEFLAATLPPHLTRYHTLFPAACRDFFAKKKPAPLFRRRRRVR
jgi:hypothetical protein